MISDTQILKSYKIKEKENNIKINCNTFFIRKRNLKKIISNNNK